MNKRVSVVGVCAAALFAACSAYAASVVEEIEMSEKDRLAVQMSIDTLLPGLIDSLVAAGNGELFKKVHRGLRACLGACVSKVQEPSASAPAP